MNSVRIGSGSVDELRLVIEKPLFGAGSATLTPRGVEVVSEIAGVLQRDFPGHVVRVDGHTDSSPVAKVKSRYPTNWELSSARASAVLRVLIEQSAVEAAHSHVAAFGAERPIGDNATEEGRKANRRVELLISL